MAKDKKSFVLYADLIGRVEHLTNDEKGILFQHLLDYVNDLNPILEDRILIGVWKPIEQQLKRDLKKFELTKEERSKSGQLGNLKRYHLDLYKRVKSEDITLKEAQRIAKTRIAEQSDTKLAVNDNVSVNDNVNVNDNDNVNEIKDKSFTINNKNFVLRVEKDQHFKETLAMQKKISISWINKKLPEFEVHCITTKKQHSNYKEFASHFNYWLKDNLPIIHEPKRPIL